MCGRVALDFYGDIAARFASAFNLSCHGPADYSTEPRLARAALTNSKDLFPRSAEIATSAIL